MSDEPKRPQGRASRASGDVWFWGACCALTAGLVLFGLVPARQERARAEALRTRLSERIEDESDARDLLSRRRGALLSEDPDEVERELRNRGYTPEGTVTVVPSDAGGDRR